MLFTTNSIQITIISLIISNDYQFKLFAALKAENILNVILSIYIHGAINLFRVR